MRRFAVLAVMLGSSVIGELALDKQIFALEADGLARVTAESASLQAKANTSQVHHQRN